MIMRFLNWLIYPNIFFMVDIKKFYDSVERADKDLTRDDGLDNMMMQLKTRIVERYKVYEYSMLSDKVVK